MQEEFKKRGVKMIALSCDDVESHKGWIKVRPTTLLLAYYFY